MELIIKITDIKESADSVPASVKAVEEAALILQESKKKIDTLLIKGRKKIDLVGESCNVEISVKDGQQPAAKSVTTETETN